MVIQVMVIQVMVMDIEVKVMEIIPRHGKVTVITDISLPAEVTHCKVKARGITRKLSLSHLEITKRKLTLSKVRKVTKISLGCQVISHKVKVI